MAENKYKYTSKETYEIEFDRDTALLAIKMDTGIIGTKAGIPVEILDWNFHDSKLPEKTIKGRVFDPKLGRTIVTHWNDSGKIGWHPNDWDLVIYAYEDEEGYGYI